MISLKEAMDWELIDRTELRYLNIEEQDLLIDIRDKVQNYQIIQMPTIRIR